MPDAVEEAKSVAYALDTRSVYTRIGKRETDTHLTLCLPHRVVIARFIAICCFLFSFSIDL
jgi:hypothetical protein